MIKFILPSGRPYVQAKKRKVRMGVDKVMKSIKKASAKYKIK